MEMPLEELMRTRALIQTQVAREITGAPLWAAPEAVAQLDDLIDRHLGRHLRDPETVAEVVGAFLGEALRKALGARWDGSEEAPYLVLPDGRTLDPLARARARIASGRSEALDAYAKAALAFAADPEAPDPMRVKARRGLFRGRWQPS